MADQEWDSFRPPHVSEEDYWNRQTWHTTIDRPGLGARSLWHQQYCREQTFWGGIAALTELIKGKGSVMGHLDASMWTLIKG